MHSRIVIAHPRRAWRQRLCWLLAQELASTGCIDEVDTVNALERKLRSTPFDLVIAHHSLVPNITILPGDHSVLLVAQLDEALLHAAREHGLLACLSENAPEALLLATLDLKPGDFLIDPTFTQWALNEATRNFEQLLLPVLLTQQEQKIVDLQQDGLSRQEIVDKLCIAENTLKRHLANISRKRKLLRM